MQQIQCTYTYIIYWIMDENMYIWVFFQMKVFLNMNNIYYLWDECVILSILKRRIRIRNSKKARIRIHQPKIWKTESTSVKTDTQPPAHLHAIHYCIQYNHCVRMVNTTLVARFSILLAASLAWYSFWQYYMLAIHFSTLNCKPFNLALIFAWHIHSSTVICTPFILALLFASHSF